MNAVIETNVQSNAVIETNVQSNAVIETNVQSNAVIETNVQSQMGVRTPLRARLEHEPAVYLMVLVDAAGEEFYYVGSTRRGLAKRRAEHLKELRQGRHHSRAVQQKYNEGCVAEFQILQAFPFADVDIDELRETEQVWLDAMFEAYGERMLNLSRSAVGVSADLLVAANRVAGKRRANTTSRFKGVNWDKDRGRWEARITVDGVTRRLLRSADELECALVYDAEVQALGLANTFTNFPKDGEAPTREQAITLERVECLFAYQCE